jgi:ADP-ribose pyrophosphatase YjhB (NUDIX family)
MNYCSHCGARLTQKIPAGDTRLRFVCERCQTVHYQNPKIVAGCIPEWHGQVLLCKRAIEPRYGLWTLPAGFMENNETAMQAALRETVEEARANVEIVGLYTLFNLPHVNQVYMMFRSRLLDLEFAAGEETLEVALFDARSLPWHELAFPTIRHTLEYYFRDSRAGGEFHFRMGDIVRKDGAPVLIEHRPPEEQ